MKYDASTGIMVFNGSTEDDTYSLDLVLAFKYLGINISCTPYKIFKAQREAMIKKAHCYKNSILSLVRSGPDRSELAYTIWKSCALPSILFGSEITPLTQEVLTELEKCNTAIGKYILQIPRSSSNVATYIDAGLQPIKALIAERVLKYANLTMQKSSTHWAKIAMNENIQMGEASPYTRYLMKWRMETNCYEYQNISMKSTLRKWCISDVLAQQRTTSYTTFAMKNRDMTEHPWFKTKSWVNDSTASKTLASFRVCNIGLGNRGPARNGKFYRMCPLCLHHGKTALNNEVRYQHRVESRAR